MHERAPRPSGTAPACKWGKAIVQSTGGEPRLRQASLEAHGESALVAIRAETATVAATTCARGLVREIGERMLAEMQTG